MAYRSPKQATIEEMQKVKCQRMRNFMEQLTSEKIATELEKHQPEDVETKKREQIFDVPNNGQVPFFPVSYCNECINRICAYLENENMADNIMKDDDDKEVEEIRIENVKKLVVSFLNHQKLYFYDHVTVEAFNNEAMERGGSKYGIFLSRLAYGDLYEKLAGKANVCATFSTGMVMQYDKKNPNTHDQLLEENVDLNTCSCFKRSDRKNKRKNETETKSEEGEEEEEEEEEEDSGAEIKSMSSDEDEKENDETVIGAEIKSMSSDEDEKENDEIQLVDDREFRPRNFIPSTKDIDQWKNARTTSSCLALCRHTLSCPVNVINKKRIMNSLMLIRSHENEFDKNNIASTKPGKYFNVISHPDNAVVFSLGATIYETTVHPDSKSYIFQSDDDNDYDSKVLAKVYTTVNTVASPFFENTPMCHIEHQNNYGFFKTFRIFIPSNFSGYYNDPSVDWRSKLYSNLTSSIAQTEARRGNLKPPLRIRNSVVSGGTRGGNYLSFMSNNRYGSYQLENLTVTAYTSMRSLATLLENMKDNQTNFIVKFRNLLVELEAVNIEEDDVKTNNTTKEETLQYLKDAREAFTTEAKFTAQVIGKYEKCMTFLQRDLGVMNKYMSQNLFGFTKLATTLNDNLFGRYL